MTSYPDSHGLCPRPFSSPLPRALLLVSSAKAVKNSGSGGSVAGTDNFPFCHVLPTSLGGGTQFNVVPRTCDACAGWLVVRSDLPSHLLIHVVVGMFYALNLSKSLKVSVRKPFTTTTICNQPTTCKANNESAHSFLKSKCFIENGVTSEKVVTRPALKNLSLVGLRQGGGFPL